MGASSRAAGARRGGLRGWVRRVDGPGFLIYSGPENFALPGTSCIDNARKSAARKGWRGTLQLKFSLLA